MRQLISGLLLSISFFIGMPSAVVYATSDTYKIKNVEDLFAFKAIVEGGDTSRNAVLTANIDMSSVTGWDGIGGTYTGTFDGNGHDISNLTGTMGLFVDNSGMIKNVGITAANISGGGNNGMLAGHNKGTVFSCYSSGSINGSSDSVGGNVGWNEGGTISGCISVCDVSGPTAGGLVGSNYGGGKMTACFYFGDNEIEGDGTKGICTDVYYKKRLDNCQQYNKGSANSVGNETVKLAINKYNTDNKGWLQLVDITDNSITVSWHSHIWLRVFEKNNTSHWYECQNNCPLDDNTLKYGYAEHTYDKKIVKNEYKASSASCTQPAAYYYSCECGAKGTETFESGEAAGHKMMKHDRIEATCTTSGRIAYYDCEACGKYFGDEAGQREITDIKIVSLGHKAVKIEAKEPTATESGNITYWYCERCEGYFKDEALTQEITKEQTVLAATGEITSSKPKERTTKPSKDKSKTAVSHSPQTGDNADSDVKVCLVLMMGTAISGAYAFSRKKKTIR